MSEINKDYAVRFLPVHLFYFFLLLVCLATLNFEGEKDSYKAKGSVRHAPSESKFSNAFTSTFKPNSNNINLFSKLLIDRAGENKVYLKLPKGNIGTEVKTFFEGKSGVINKLTSTLVVKKDVHLKREGSNTTASELLVDYKTNSAIAKGQVESRLHDIERKVRIKSSQLIVRDKGEKLKYLGNVSGEIRDKKRKPTYSNIKFKSDLLIFNNYDRVITLEGNAFIIRGKSEIRALFGKIWLNNQSSGVKYFSMNDDVKLRDEFINPYGRIVKRNSFSEKIEGFVLEEKLILSGFPQVEQEGDIIKGNKMIIREDQEVIEIINTNSQFQLNNGEQR